VIVENGETLVNCLAYIDLNPLRAGLVERPEQYRWNSLGYHIQTNQRPGRDVFVKTTIGSNMNNRSYPAVHDFLQYYFRQ